MCEGVLEFPREGERARIVPRVYIRQYVMRLAPVQIDAGRHMGEGLLELTPRPPVLQAA